MPGNSGIAVYCEIKEGKLVTIAAEGLGIGRKLADEMGEKLSAILIGGSVSGAAYQAIVQGAEEVYTIENPVLEDYLADSYLSVMEKVMAQVNPLALIMGQTDTGRDLAPRLAFRLKTTATLDCIDLAIEPDTKRLLRTKPVYGGNAMAVYIGDDEPQVVTIRNRAMKPLEADESRRGEIIDVDAGLEPSTERTKILEKVVEELAGVKIEDAQVVVAGGRGIGGADEFWQLEELAGLLKGAVAASRPPCDNGWLPDTKQVGLTGKIIAPELYIAIAISGSSQHMSGCSGSKTIVAINKDSEANIFRFARFGVVGDWKKVLPAFTKKLKELLAS